jgi:hypothetical protein
MRKRVRTILCAAAVGSALAALSSVRASDHLDGPRATADPAADITDVFAFTSPENPSNVVLAMAVTPYATASSRFSSQVNYTFRVRLVTAPQPLTLGDTALDVTCNVDDGTPQQVTCTGPRGLRARANVGDVTGGTGAGMRVFAGLRSDPAFFDRQGALAAVSTGRADFTGRNAFAGANVLAIVVELDARGAFLPPPDGGADGAVADADESGDADDTGAEGDAGPTGADGDAGAEDASTGVGDAGGATAVPMPILAVAGETSRRAP